tara:strand:- start:425 stop:3640 length:3216 start_codon:yes stop_codon:yes gene_type:complete
MAQKRPVVRITIYQPWLANTVGQPTVPKSGPSLELIDMRKTTVLTLLVVTLTATSTLFAADSSVDFSKDILSVLSDRCFKCHGPDEAERVSDLRLDTKEGIFSTLDSDVVAVVPGKLNASEMIKRITSDNPDLKMPPEDSGKVLSEAEIDALKQWVSNGAEWEEHWAFISPTKPEAPRAIRKWKPVNPVDLFIHQRLKAERLQPSPKADKQTLIRRVTLDLTGLPPTVEAIDAFLADTSDDAFEKVIDRLMKSERYGEHMARHWLDAARFADTHGLHLDNERQIWPYRDWVINAFNQNMPFDQFTTEQLAGDLLPEPSLEQRVATGFNRCNVTTSEGGSIDEEYYVRYAVDRVNTTSTVWMGLTSGCAQCHDHKFDPLTQKEFYQLFSYFFSLTEKAMDGNALLPPPVVKVPSEDQVTNKDRITKELADAKALAEKTITDFQYTDANASDTPFEISREERVWIDDELPAGAQQAGDGDGPWQFVSGPDHPVFSGEKSHTRTGEGLNQHFFTGATEPLVIAENDVFFTYVFLDPDNPPESIQLQFNDGSWDHRAHWGADKCFLPGKKNALNFPMGALPKTGEWVRLEVPAKTVGLNPGAKINGWAFTQFGGTTHWDKAGIVTTAALNDEQLASISTWEAYQKAISKAGLPENIGKLIDVAADQRNDDQKNQILRYYLTNVNPKSKAALAAPVAKQAELQKALEDLEKAIPSSLVMEDRAEKRQAHILERGEYTLKRDPVESAVPEWLGTSKEDAPNNRLGLAQWLVDPSHPLTSRVTVNRLWQQFFGIGIVRTSEDFGVQGERPVHPELLDWLAIEFIENGWDVQAFQKTLLLSATYQQSSRVTKSNWEADPENRLLASGPRHRLDAEVIRDQALAVSGLLVGNIGGKSVKPYQPAGLWKPVGFGGSNTSVFNQDSGDALYRRSMYTFWKRTVPPPTMSIFDAPDRETCQVRRARTNTPLQALALMNDVQFLEAARHFAERIITNGGATSADRIDYAYRSVLSRTPKPSERAVVEGLFNEYLAEFQSTEGAATEFLNVGESKRNEELEANELGAWTMVAHMLLNLSETVTKN